MADREIHSPAELRQLLRYEPMTGKLYWLPRPSSTMGNRAFNAQFAGKEAFTCRMGRKHLQGRIHRRSYLAHRVIWAIVHGEWPKGQIDHINGDPIDNRLANLRDIPGAENQRNMKRNKLNTSGVGGVDWQPNRKMWRVRVKAKGRDIHVGRFKEFGDAVKARADALERFGYHPNHGRA